MSQARIQKWGNSLAVRIPKPYAAQVGLGPNSVVNVSIVDGRLLLEPVRAAPIHPGRPAGRCH
jgi:antitoxin MazE